MSGDYQTDRANSASLTNCIFCFHNVVLRINVCVYLSLQWSLVCDSAWKVHIAKFSLLVGSIFGYLVFGILADW